MKAKVKGWESVDGRWRARGIGGSGGAKGKG